MRGKARFYLKGHSSPRENGKLICCSLGGEEGGCEVIVLGCFSPARKENRTANRRSGVQCLSGLKKP